MAEDQKSGGAKNPISDEELRVAFSTPAVLANKFYASVTPAGVRLAFAEMYRNIEPDMRGAVLIPFPDAMELRDLLIRQLENIRVELVEGQEGTQAEQTDG